MWRWGLISWSQILFSKEAWTGLLNDGRVVWGERAWRMRAILDVLATAKQTVRCCPVNDISYKGTIQLIPVNSQSQEEQSLLFEDAQFRDYLLLNNRWQKDYHLGYFIFITSVFSFLLLLLLITSEENYIWWGSG